MKDREFAKWLDSEMTRRAWSASELARRIGMRRQTIYKWLNAERLPEPESALKLATALGVHVDEVLIFAGIRPAVEPVSRFDQERRIREVEHGISALRNAATKEGVPIPLIGVVPANKVRWAAIGDLGETVTVPEEWVDAHGAPLAAVRVSGDCLRALGVLDGDTVILERLQPEEVRSGDVVVIRMGDDYTMKIWIPTQNGIELQDAEGNVVHRINIMDDFEIVGVARYRHGRVFARIR